MAEATQPNQKKQGSTEQKPVSNASSLAEKPEQQEAAGTGKGKPEAPPARWSVRFPLKAEKVTVEKEATVFEEVRIRRQRRESTVHFQDTVWAEQLWLDRRGVAVAEERRQGP